MKSRNRKHTVKSQFAVIIQPDETGGFWAFCPTIPGCASQGETIEETLLNMREAIAVSLENSPRTSKNPAEPISLHLVIV